MHTYGRWQSGRRWAEHDGLHHAVLIIDGGYLMDNEAAIACTGEREPKGLEDYAGVPTCVACWAVVLS